MERPEYAACILEDENYTPQKLLIVSFHLDSIAEKYFHGWKLVDFYQTGRNLQVM